ncbi:MAG: serine/threonine-protein kinase, partial [Planctomycetota bacterium]
MLGRIGEFEVSGIVGIGGMGAVLKGFDPSLLRVVAIKVMAPHLANNGSARARFEREARAAAAISHPNVVEIFRVSEKDGLPYLVMPFARGPSLQKRIDADGPLSTLEVIQTGRQIASGLAAAHEQGLVHRDIKPANILLSDGLERLLITDFGVARAMDDVSMTQTGLIAGTPQYMSPEQARGEWVDHRSDQFSLGAVLYNACTGRPPFRAEAPFAVLRKVTDSDPRPIREINPEIPAWLESLIHRLLAKSPEDRFEDAEEVAQLFEKCVAHFRQPTQIELPKTIVELKPAVATKPKPLSTKVKPSFKRIGVVVSLIALMSTSIAALVLYFSGAPDIAGQWQGEVWPQVQLSSVEAADNWFVGNFNDADGNVGAIHLEWSPISRRFDGRWSIGSKKSGTIVLRPGTNGSVRGAILVDSEMGQLSASSRLRDFSWRRGEFEAEFRSATSETVPSYGDRVTKGGTQGMNVFSPVEGVVKKVMTGVQYGKRISKGEVILEVESEELALQLR